MEFNVYKFKSICEKMYTEGKADAQARMRFDEASTQYWGDELVAKHQKYDGTYTYYFKEEVVKEILEYFITINEVITTVYNWDFITGKPEHISKKDSAFLRFVSGLKFNRDYLESILKCYKGSPMYSFYRDPLKVQESKEQEACKQAVRDMWTP